MKARLAAQGREWRIDLDRPIDLSIPIGFSTPALRHFGAPAPQATPFATGDFTGAVATGASCNCRTITLTPHCNGTHTECAGHLTLEPLDAWRVVPAGPVPALVVSVAPVREGDDLVVTRAALDAAWPREAGVPEPLALVLRTRMGEARLAEGPAAFLAADAAALIVARDIAHLVIDQPSLDRTHDAGRLAAHRVFFGLPPGGRSLAQATRPQATVTEYAWVPDALPDGPCMLAWQVPAIAGDAVPSRPLAYRYEP
ncbi:MAG: cyclase family protein [Steroidobacteraceae bacterium]